MTDVFSICMAYESGADHGWDRNKIINPHLLDPDEFLAFELGYQNGFLGRFEDDGDMDSPVFETVSLSKGMCNHSTKFTREEIIKAFKKALKT